MANVRTTVTVIAAFAIVSGSQVVAEVLAPVRPNITHHVRRVTVRTEKETGRSVPTSRCCHLI